MAALTPKQFIETVFINELAELSEKNHYISFLVMATGIEFLGKCLDSKAAHWNVGGRSQNNFEDALQQLGAFTKYRPYKKILYED